MQIHGDWMKGVWKGAGKKVGEDFGCINIPGTKAVSVTVDSFGILGGVKPDVLKAELDFAATVVDPQVNATFASFKGSSPVRVDVPTDKLDACNNIVLDNLKKPGFSVENPFYISDPDYPHFGVERDVCGAERPEDDDGRRHQEAQGRIFGRVQIRRT